jgi:dihydrofolate reductase
MSNIIYTAVSLDGYIAKKDGSIDWLMETRNAGGSDLGFRKFIENIDTIVMGRNTFELVMTFESWFYTKPFFVLSSTLKSISEKLAGNAEFLNYDQPTVVKKHNSRNYYNLYIDGGKTMREFLKLNLIDDMIITQIPILPGEGIPLFGFLSKEQKFKLKKSEVLLNTLVKNHYMKIKL